MKVLLQRVKRGGVATVSKSENISAGLVVFVGIGKGDTEADADFLAQKAADIRIFSNREGKFDYSVRDTGGEILVISQFTLYADCSRGRRPDFTKAALPPEAEKLYDRFIEKLRAGGCSVKTGVFGADMEVTIINDGPVTVMLESGGRAASGV